MARLPEVRVPVVKEMAPMFVPTVLPMRDSSAFVSESVVEDPDPCELALPSMFTKHVVVLSEGQLVALTATGMRRDRTPANMASFLDTFDPQQNSIDKSLLLATFVLVTDFVIPQIGYFRNSSVIAALRTRHGRRDSYEGGKLHAKDRGG